MGLDFRSEKMLEKQLCRTALCVSVYQQLYQCFMCSSFGETDLSDWAKMTPASGLQWLNPKEWSPIVSNGWTSMAEPLDSDWTPMNCPAYAVLYLWGAVY